MPRGTGMGVSAVFACHHDMVAASDERGQSPDASRRGAGLLAHITSLPGRFGIGDLGAEAHAFVSSIAAAGQRYWQLLPVGPTGFGNSPYSSLSTFAGNPLLISPEMLCDAGLIDADELASVEMPENGEVDYGAVYLKKLGLIRMAARRFPSVAGREQQDRLAVFVEERGPEWLEDYCLYDALKEAHDGRAWSEWALEVARREPGAMARARGDLQEAIAINRVIQFLFFEQWYSLHRSAVEHGVSVVGDLPLYVAHDSADVWANPDLFLL
ncbi:MAG TPA: 4-alpha-glucanotransferase, partial [Acidimicrobiia bacterium]